MFGEEKYEQGEPPNETHHLLRIIAWLIFGIAAVGGTYLYFYPPPWAR